MSTFGPAYDENIDGERVSKQHHRIRNYMLGCSWMTLAEIAHALDYPEASISAQLRHLRKERFGGYLVDKRRRPMDTGAQWEYRVREPEKFAFDSNGQADFVAAR